MPDPRSMADTFKVDSRSAHVGSPEWFRQQQMKTGQRVGGIGSPGKTRRTREKNARTIKNRIARAEQQKKGKNR